MKQFGLENIRNIILLSHAGAGKTSTSEAVLFTAGVISRLGRVDDGTTTSDFDPDEMKRKISINLTLLPCPWRDTKVNLIDAPGYLDFVGEVRAGLRVADSAVILMDATSGVQVGTELVWGYADEAKLPRLIFVNKMDRENADFAKTVKAASTKFGAKCLPIQMPIGAHTSFKGVIDLLSMKSYAGTPSKEAEIPADLKSEADSYREKLVEAVAEVDDKLIEKYLGGEQLTLEEFKTTLRKATVSGKIVPILVGSALQNFGMSWLLDAICDYLPSPGELKVSIGGNMVEPSETAPLVALVFKTSADPYVGKLTYFRVYTGVIASNSQVWNAARNAHERIGQLFILRGKSQEPVPEVRAGDIGAVAKLALTATGDTLCSQDKPVTLPPIEFPEPVFSEAVYPKTKLDLDKLGAALARLVEEDLTLRMRRDADVGETVLSGMGETHLDVAAERMQRKFGVGTELRTPRVPYKETITTSTKAEFKHKKQSGGHGQYGHVLLELEPLPRGSKVEFASKVVGGSIPRNFIPAVEKGVNEAVHEGVLARFPVVDVRATVYDGSYHDVDSSEMAFKIAAVGAMKKGLSQAQPTILEPIMNLKVTIPGDLTGEIIGDLNTKRGRIIGMNPQGDINVIEAQVPAAEVLRYAINLKSMTQGRGIFTTEFSHYEQVPSHVAQKIIAEREAEKAEKA